MSIKQVKFSHSEHEFRTLAEWEEELSIPANTLLHHASQGHLQPFIKPHFIEVDYYSVHLSLFDPDQTLEALEEIPRNYLPMHMGLDPRNVLGLVLGKEECASLSHGVEIKGAQHYSAILYKNMLWVDTLAPFPGRLENPTRPEDWRIAGYLNSMTYHSNDKKQFPWNPLSQTVLPRGGFIRDSDMKAFLSKLRSHEFISDLYRDGKIIEDRDVYPYISKRLGEIIDANWLYWKNYESIPNEEKERRQSRMIEYFNGDFRTYCDNQTNDDSLVKFAANICEPSLLPDSQEPASSPVTPGILAMLTAAKLYWSATHIKLDDPRTHPERNDIAGFLQHLGLTGRNEAQTATTIIRPEGARKVVPRRKPQAQQTQ